MFGFSSKEEFDWWREDNRGKFYGICAAGVIAVVALVVVFVSVFNKPEEVVVEEDVVTEIEVVDFDVDKAIEEQRKTVEEERDERYGKEFCFSPYTLSEENAHGGVFVTIFGEELDECLLYVESGLDHVVEAEEGQNVDEAIENEDVWLSTDTWYDMFFDNEIYTLRGAFSDIDPSIIKAWEEEDYQNVLSMFADKDFNKTTAKAWDNHLQELKVANGYKKNDGQSDIADDDWDSIQSQMKDWFEQYLTTIDVDGKEIPVKEEDSEEEIEEEEPMVNILEAYLSENPLPVYSNIKVASSPIYLCEVDGTPYGELNDKVFDNYQNIYWGTYFAKAKDELLNEGDNVGLLEKGYEDGVFYHLTKRVNFTITNDIRDKEMVIWLRNANGTQEFYYYPAKMWSSDDSDYVREYYKVPVSSDVQYFAYFYIGKKYDVEEKMDGFETALEEKNSWDDGVFEVKDTIQYERTDIYGFDTVLLVSDFVLLDGSFEIPSEISYLFNDTDYYVDITEETTRSTAENFQPGDELFIDRNYINTISWKVR